MRLDRFLADVAETEDDSALGGLSRARLQKLIADDQVRVDGGTAKRALRLRGGERLSVQLPPPAPSQLAPEPMDLDVLYEDDDLIAVNKPAGLVVHPAAGHATGTLVHGLLHHCRDLSGVGGELRPGIVHRLDRGTSGVMIAAKNDRAHEALSAEFSERRAVKIYAAFVIGSPSPDSGTIATFYDRHPRQRKKFTSRVQRGRRAVTHYAMRMTAGGISALRVRIATGRTHQIRVHMSESGWPLAGDPLYGPRRLVRISDTALRAQVAQLQRQALHAQRLQIPHPRSGVQLDLTAPLPNDLLQLEQALAALVWRSG